MSVILVPVAFVCGRHVFFCVETSDRLFGKDSWSYFVFPLCFLCEISCVLSFLCYNKVLFENGYCSQAMFREVFWGIKLVEK